MNKNSWVCEFYFTTIFLHKIIIYFNSFLFIIISSRKSKTRAVSRHGRAATEWEKYFSDQRIIFVAVRKLNEREENENSKEREIFRERKGKARGWEKQHNFFSVVDTHGHNKKKEKYEIFINFTEMWLSLLMLLNWKLVRINRRIAIHCCKFSVFLFYNVVNFE